MPKPPVVFIDAPLLLQAEDAADAARHAAARAWMRALWLGRCGRLSTQVLSDFYVHATRRLHPPMPQGDARAEVRRYQQWRPWVNDHATVETAWAMEARYGLDFAQALMVAAARQQGCTLLLSEALPHQQRFDGLQILNPYLVGPEGLVAAA